MAKADFPNSQAYTAAAWLLMADVRAMQAVAQVEAGPGGAFLPTDEPVILFERHIFERLTHGRFSGQAIKDAPDSWNVISSSAPGGYGPVSVQHRRLQFAASLDREAALESCSWGLYQILGVNHAAAGFPKLQRFVNAMYRSVDDHLRAFVLFIRHDDRLVDALREKDWRAFAAIYNGPAYARNKYDLKMADAFNSLAGEGA